MAVRHVALVSVVTLAVGYTSLAPAAPTSAVDLRKQDCAVLGSLNDAESGVAAVVALMFEYQRNMAKESKADTALEKQAVKTTLAAKAGKLSQDNRAIDQGMKEAQEKADVQMSAATTSLVIGMVQGLVQIGAAAASYAKAPSDQESRRLAGTTIALKSDLAKLSTDLKRSDALASQGKGKRLPPGDVNKMKDQLEKGLQDIRNAKKSARPC